MNDILKIQIYNNLIIPSFDLELLVFVRRNTVQPPFKCMICSACPFCIWFSYSSLRLMSEVCFHGIAVRVANSSIWLKNLYSQNELTMLVFIVVECLAELCILKCRVLKYTIVMTKYSVMEMDGRNSRFF